MRTWRKIYASLLESEQVTQLSDGALILLTFLIIAQDDSGYYPWNESKIRRLTVTRPLHTWDDFTTWRDEIVTAGIAHLEQGGIVLINGAALNGHPRKDLKPELYPRNEPVTDPLHTRNESVTPSLPKSRVEKSRGEERRGEGGEVKTSPTPPQTPEHFIKLTALPGFNSRNHSKAYENIESACAAAGVQVEAVVTQFCPYFEAHRFRHGWKDPVKALVQTVHIEIKKLLQPTSYQRPKDIQERLKELERGASRGRPVQSL